MPDHYQRALELHQRLRGKLSISAKSPIKSMEELSLLYTPGVAEPCRRIAQDKGLAYELTMKHNTVAIVTDGTRVLGLGDIGPEASLPVMEGKALIMQQFAGIDAFPIALNTKDPDAFVDVVKAMEPVFGAINLEDVATPKVFHIEKRLEEELSIPVFHDDQHGTAVVVLAGLINAMKLTGKGKDAKVAMVGAGAAGYGISRLLRAYGVEDVIVFDSRGAIHKGRELPGHKEAIAENSNPGGFSGQLKDFRDADILIAASKPDSVPRETVMAMRKPSIVFTLSNPTPEIPVEEAMGLGIDVFGTGRSDFPNQINNSICFPGFLRAILDLRVRKITDRMKIAAAEGIASCVAEDELSKERIVPDAFDPHLVGNIKRHMDKAI